MRPDEDVWGRQCYDDPMVNSVDNVCVFLWPRARVVSAIACSEEQKMVGREIEWIYEIPQ